MNYKKLAVKALVTFVEAFVAAMPLADGIHKLAVAGAIGASLSVVWNTSLYPALQQYLKN